MIRGLLKNKKSLQGKDFVLRGEAQTRIETLSDAVFAIAIALLVLSSSVPERYDELLLSMQDIIPFGVCITLLMLIWYPPFNAGYHPIWCLHYPFNAYLVSSFQCRISSHLVFALPF